MPGITVGITGPVSSWMSWPNVVSSCGGRPTTVNGQIASLAMIDMLDVQHRKLVRQAVVAQMIAERPFQLLRCIRLDTADDAEIGIGIDRQIAGRGRSCGMRWPASAPANVSSLIPSGSGITAASVIAGWPPTKMFTRKRLAGTHRRRVMHADAAMNLIVQADLAVGHIAAAGKLHAVHAQVRMRQARLIRHPRYTPAAA